MGYGDSTSEYLAKVAGEYIQVHLPEVNASSGGALGAAISWGSGLYELGIPAELHQRIQY